MYSPHHEPILEYFYDKTGIHFDEKKDVVAHKINSFYKSKSYHDENSFLEGLKRDANLWQEFVNLLTVNETYFYRETKQVELLASMAKKMHGFDILCAPSSSGEEPYTILMILAQSGLLGKVGRLVGIDINSDVIEKAKEGVYSKRSLHRTPPEVASKYFREDDENRYAIANDIKRIADFRVMNIFDHDIKRLGQFDFVFSRNMIIYFDKKSRLEAEKALVSLLKPGGILFLGHADIVQNSFNLEKTVVGGIVYYKKEQ